MNNPRLPPYLIEDAFVIGALLVAVWAAVIIALAIIFRFYP